VIKGLSRVALLMIVLCVCDGGEKVSLLMVRLKCHGLGSTLAR
jgi:hypothetical protein